MTNKANLTLIALICLYCAHLLVIEAEESSPIVLTEAEQQWLRDHPKIHIGVDPDWKPIEFVDAEGNYNGMSADYVALLSRRLGLTMEIVPGLTWTQIIKGAKRRQLDAVPMVQKTRSGWRFGTSPSPICACPRSS